MSKTKDKAPSIDEIKNALLPSIAELFESQAVRLEKKLKTEIHGVKILMEQMDSKIETALEIG